jgi:hypothetical protein
VGTTPHGRVSKSGVRPLIFFYQTEIEGLTPAPGHTDGVRPLFFLLSDENRRSDPNPATQAQYAWRSPFVTLSVRFGA